MQVLLLVSMALVSQHSRSVSTKKLCGTWKKIGSQEVCNQFLIFTDRKHGKSRITGSPDYQNGIAEVSFRYKVSGNGREMTFVTDTEKPEIAKREMKLSLDTLCISLRSSIYYAIDRYVKQ